MLALQHWYLFLSTGLIANGEALDRGYGLSSQKVSRLADFIFSVFSYLVAAPSTAQKQHSMKSLMSFLLSNPWSGFQSSSLLSSRKSCALLSLKLSFRGF